MLPPPRCVVVSGASRGLGSALARRFAAPGVALRLLARSPERLARTAAACAARGAEAASALLDARDGPALSERLLSWDAERPIDCVIADAGICRGTTPDGAWEGVQAASEQVAVDLIGAMRLVEPLLPALRARRCGRIALIASLAAHRGLPDALGYCASKAGLRAHGEALRAALGPEGVAVALPGVFDRAMGARRLGPRPLAVGLETAARRIHRAILHGSPRLALPLPLAALLRLLDALPAPLSDRAGRLLRFRIAAEA